MTPSPAKREKDRAAATRRRNPVSARYRWRRSAARRLLHVAIVQNRYTLADRTSEAVLDYCAREGIGFIPWFPLAAGDLAKPGSLLDSVTKKHGATPSQIALAWVLRRSPVMLPIPGTSKLAHLEDNVATARIKLCEEDFTALDQAGEGAGQQNVLTLPCAMLQAPRVDQPKR